VTAPLPSWKVSKSDDFISGFSAHCAGNDHLREAALKRMKKIEMDPLCGDTKTGMYRNCRSEHVERHWVIGYYLVPPIGLRQHLPKLQEIVFFFFGHHDEWNP
jgi:hypothetical protein